MLRLPKSAMTVCRVCKTLQLKKQAEIRSNGRKVFRDESGKRWDSRCCPNCHIAEVISRSRRNGKSSSRSDCTDATSIKGFKSEQIVKSFFEQIGFSVTQSLAHGPDLIAKMGDILITCEVKSAVMTKQYRGKKYWVINKVYPKRKNDDLIAFVFEDGSLAIDSMGDHLRKCGKSGRRSIKWGGQWLTLGDRDHFELPSRQILSFQCNFYMSRSLILILRH